MSAILWALTGYRARKQDAPIRETGSRAPILNDAGKQVGTWPPIVNYPTAQADLSADVLDGLDVDY